MIREVLHKAKVKNWKEIPDKKDHWVEGYYAMMGTGENAKHYIVQNGYLPHLFEKEQDNYYFNDVEIDIETLCGYTSLNDRNGNKVWENDIVKYWSYHDGDDYAQIKFGTYQSCFDKMESKHHGFYVNWESNRRKDLGYWLEWTDYAEIVGNIFDNPELLNKS